MFNKNKTGNNEITKKPLSKKIKDFISALRKGSKVFSALTMLQLKEAIENKSKGNKKKLIQIIVFTVVKFVLVAGVTLGIIMILNYIGLLALSEMVKFYVLILTLLLVLTLFSCVNNLTKSLYYSEDNKVLVTFPVSSSSLFISKIGVFFVFELKRAFDAIIPITFGFVLTAVIMGVVNVGALFWCWFPLIAAILVVVLLASVLSVPYLYILQFLKKYPLIELLLILGIIGGVITGIVFLINLIPANIDLVASWPKIKADLNKGLDQALIYLYPFDKLVRSMFGDVVATSIQWQLTSSSFAVYGIYLASAVGLFAINLLLLKPFYFVMMTKTFEYEKDVLDVGKKNKVHKRYITFTNKELKITFRDIEVSGSYIAVYIITPLLLLFLDAIFSAITTKLEGDLMTYAFNILLILIPLLASNASVASLYSKEGRAAYMKKTKPINPLLPLVSKLIFNLVLSIPSVVACACIFGNFAKLSPGIIVMLSLTLLFVQYGHVIFSATTDLMHPLNEKYATGDSENSDANERTSTIVGFVISFLFAVVAYLLFLEGVNSFQSDFTIAFVKLLIISIAIFGSFTLLFVLKVKAYYYER